MKITQYSRNKLLPLASGLALLCASVPATAASDYFLKFDGINGSSVVKGHENAIEFTSFDWGVSIAHSSIGGGSGVGKPVFKDFSWEQTLDKSVTGLFNSALSGKAIKNAVVDFVTYSGGSAPQTYFRLTFDTVFLTSLDYTASNGSLVGLDGSFAYDKVTLDYWAQDKTGKFLPAGTATYDLKTNTGSLSGVTALFAQGLAGPQAAVVPEPENYAMLLAGLGLIGVIARRRLGA